jgi:MATE family multidrug resistance protein
MPPLVAFQALTKYLQSQHILFPLVVIGFFANILNGILDYVMIYQAGLGLRGAAIATSFSRWTQFLMLCVFLVCNKRHQHLWPTMSFAPLMPAKLRAFLSLGLYGGLMVGLECWAFTITTFMAGYLGALALAAHSSALLMTSTSYMWYILPLSVAISIRVGNLLGANEPAKAKQASRVAMGIMAFSMIVIAVSVKFNCCSEMWGFFFF